MLRITCRMVAMAGWLLTALVLYHAWKLLPVRNPWPRRFLAGVAQIAGVRIRTTGKLAHGQLLVLANHVSWIDVPALAATTGAAFVAHDGLASVRALKWLCDMNDTIFIARHDRSSIPAQIAALRGSLADKGTLTIFPEGTTSDGTRLLPFKSSLLAALDPPIAGLAVQPVWLDYGSLIPEIAWVDDETGIANFKRILGRAEPLKLTIHFLEPLDATALISRKTMASAAHHAIIQAMTPLQNADGLP
jgi:1-acyl-sn-glycerol-3-phosphate acyltransferase